VQHPHQRADEVIARTALHSARIAVILAAAAEG
jgi:hypothetical protein